MKTIRIAICAVTLAGVSMTALSDTYLSINEKGQKVYSDRAPIGVPYTVKFHSDPSPSIPRTAPPSVPAPSYTSYAGDPRMIDTYAADASSAIRERRRGQTRECLGLQQSINRLSSSRNYTVDPETGRSLEDRQAREAQESYNALCGS